MFARLSILMLAGAFAFPSAAQEAKPDLTYTLHAAKQRRGAYTPRSPDRSFLNPLVLAPDNSLIEVIPASKERWALKRVSGWDTHSPREDTLWIETGHREMEDVRFDGDVWVNPAATYAIVRIIATSGNTRLEDIGLDNVVVVVDLASFKQLTRTTTRNRLLTTRDWEFGATGVLLARTDTDDPTSRLNRDYAALSVPKLEPVARCQFQEYYDQDAKRKTVGPDADSRCAEVLKAGGRPSVLNSGRREKAWDSVAKALNPGAHCGLAAISEGDRYALFDCSTSELTFWDRVKNTSREVQVFDISDRRLVFYRSLPPGPDIALGLGRSKGRDWLLVLREAVRLEVYKLR